MRRPFQSTLSRGERLFIKSLQCKCTAFQSTLSRGERPARQSVRQCTISISIHALTRRAATYRQFVFNISRISIHALTRRAAPAATPVISRNSDFNPRSHEESGSIFEHNHSRRNDFNPRSHEESGPIVINTPVCAK